MNVYKKKKNTITVLKLSRISKHFPNPCFSRQDLHCEVITTTVVNIAQRPVSTPHLRSKKLKKKNAYSGLGDLPAVAPVTMNFLPEKYDSIVFRSDRTELNTTSDSERN